MVARDDERVALRGGVDVHEADRPVVGVDDGGGQVAGDDLAEEAVRIRGHGRGLYPPPPPMPARRAELEQIVRTLESWERGSASEGERRSAEWIAERLRGMGLEPKVEGSPRTATYWWPLGLLQRRWPASAGAAAARRLARAPLAARRRSRRLGRARACGAALDARAAAEAHDVERPRRGRATRTRSAIVAIVAHHDAAHTGAIFDFTLIRWYARTFPELLERGRKWPGLLWSVFLGPALVARRRAARAARSCAASAGSSARGGVATFADIGRSPVVPGANDNLSAVAAMLEAGRALVEEPARGRPRPARRAGQRGELRGGHARRSSSGTRTSCRRTAPTSSSSTPSARPHLILLEGEGMLVARPYDERLKDEIAAAATEIGVPIIREHWLSFASDALVGLRKGYRTAAHRLLRRRQAPDALPPADRRRRQPALGDRGAGRERHRGGRQADRREPRGQARAPPRAS